jgi:hypothetical protein
MLISPQSEQRCSYGGSEQQVRLVAPPATKISPVDQPLTARLSSFLLCPNRLQPGIAETQIIPTNYTDSGVHSYPISMRSEAQSGYP